MASLPRRQYSAAEWETKKDAILKLRATGIGLAAIVKELDKRYPDFRPTLPMLKKRMGEWGIGSYHKEPDIAEAVRITAQREKINKKTIFKIGDKTVTQEEIVRYLKRKGVRNQRVWAANISKDAPSAIVPYTPPPTPPPTDSSSQSEGTDDTESSERLSPNEIESRRFTAARNMFVETYSREHIWQTVQGNHESQMLTKALYHTNSYCDRLFFMENLMPNMSDSTADALNDFTNGMWKGWDFLFDDNPDAFHHFNEGFASLNKLVKEHNRRFLPELLEMLLNLQLEPQIDILQRLLKQLADLYKNYGLTHDVLYHVVESLLQLDNKTRMEVVEQLMNNVWSHFNTRLGEGDAETKSIKKALTRSVYRKLPVSKAIGDLQYHLERDEVNHDMDLFDKCNVCIELALCYRSRRDLPQVEYWINQAMAIADMLTSIFHRTDMRVRCHRVMSYVERRKDNWQGAYRHWLDAVAESSVGLGPTDSLTVLVQSEMADFKVRATGVGVVLIEEEVRLVEVVAAEEDFFDGSTEASFVASSEGGLSNINDFNLGMPTTSIEVQTITSALLQEYTA